jgi:F420-non-reducing hydrogenase small subunit
MSGANGNSHKPQVAFYWCASCGGCEEAVVDLNEEILAVVAAVDIRLWPVALDFKKSDVEAMADGELAAAFINGAIRTSEQEEMAHLLRRKAKAVLAFGACAQLGGIPGLANLSTKEDILNRVYGDGPRPQTAWGANGHTLHLPEFWQTVKPLDQVIEVDYYVPGCAPTPGIIRGALDALLSGKLPPPGSVLAPDRALCDECPRKDSKPEKLLVAAYHRPHQILADESKCLLAQGIVCLGPATRGGCEAACVKGNMPCSGCFGPTSRVRDPGAKALSSLAAIADSTEEAEIASILAGIPDPAGTFYRYSLPGSLLGRRREAAQP